MYLVFSQRVHMCMWWCFQECTCVYNAVSGRVHVYVVHVYKCGVVQVGYLWWFLWNRKRVVVVREYMYMWWCFKKNICGGCFKEGSIGNASGREYELMIQSDHNMVMSIGKWQTFRSFHIVMTFQWLRLREIMYIWNYWCYITEICYFLKIASNVYSKLNINVEERRVAQVKHSLKYSRLICS